MEIYMEFFELIIKGLLFGVALAMDAFSVSLANGLNDPAMRKRKMCLIAGTFSFFQALMPLIGWLCIRTIASYFKAFELAIPYIALVLLLIIGGKMIFDSIGEMAECKRLAAEGAPLEEEPEKKCGTSVGFLALLIQGVATSIDALSVGFDIAHLDFIEALIEAIVIAVSTFIICILGVALGKKCGTKLAGKATIFGGIILIAIGFEIFISSFFK